MSDISIGVRVKVVGPSVLGDNRHLGESFLITGAVYHPCGNHFPFRPYDGTYYLESSLEALL